MIVLENLSKRYHDVDKSVLNNINLTIHPNEILVLLGRSGSGKSTLLRLLNRLITNYLGEIYIDDSNLKQYSKALLRQSMSFVSQDTCLFPHMTAQHNIQLPLKVQKQLNHKQMCERCDYLLDLVELNPAEYRDRYPHELSGGEQQRIGIARALAIDPKYLLMDEPFSALDAITRETLQDVVIRLKEKLNKCVVFVTHDIQEALHIADRIAILNNGHLDQVANKNDLNDVADIDKLVNEIKEQL